MDSATTDPVRTHGGAEAGAEAGRRDAGLSCTGSSSSPSKEPRQPVPWAPTWRRPAHTASPHLLAPSRAPRLGPRSCCSHARLPRLSQACSRFGVLPTAPSPLSLHEADARLHPQGSLRCHLLRKAFPVIPWPGPLPSGPPIPGHTLSASYTCLTVTKELRPWERVRQVTN